MRNVALLFIICLGLATKPAYGQTTQPYKAVKLYANYQDVFDGRNHVFRLTPAFIYQGQRKHFHEIELNRLDRDRSTETRDTRIGLATRDIVDNHLALRYQLGWNVHRSQSIDLYLSGGLLIQGRSSISEAIPNAVFKRNRKSAQAIVGIVPGMRCAFSDRWMADVNIPVDVYEIGYYFERIYNPNIPIRQQKNQETIGAWSLLSNFHFRVGVAYRW